MRQSSQQLPETKLIDFASVYLVEINGMFSLSAFPLNRAQDISETLPLARIHHLDKRHLTLQVRAKMR